MHTIVGKASFDEQQLAENIDDAARRDRARETLGVKGDLPAQRHAGEHDGSRRQGRSEPRKGNRVGYYR